MKTFIIISLLSFFTLSSVIQITAQPVPVKTDTVKVSIKLSDVNFKYLIDSFASVKAKYLVLKSQIPQKGSSPMSWIWWLSLVLSAVYELIVTIIPTTRNLKLLNVASNIINMIAKLFNGVGNAAKLPDGTVGAFVSTPTAVPKINPLPVQATTILLLLFLCSGLQAQDKHPLRIYPVTKTVAIQHNPAVHGAITVNEYQSKDSTIFLGPSTGIDVFQLETKTGNYTIGITPGVGYGFKWAPNKNQPYLIAIDLFLKTGLSVENTANNPNYFNIQTTLNFSAVGGWINIGAGFSEGLGLNGAPNKSTPILTIGTKIPI